MLPFLPRAATRTASSAASSPAAAMSASICDCSEAISVMKTPKRMAGPEGPVTLRWLLGLGRLIHQSLEGGGLVDGEVAQHLAADVIVLQRAIDRGVGGADRVLATAAKALCGVEDLVAAGAARNGAGCTTHGSDTSAIGHPALHAPGLGLGQGVHAAQVAGTFGRVVDQPVALADLMGLDLALGGEFEALLGARLGLQFGHFAFLWNREGS